MLIKQVGILCPAQLITHGTQFALFDTIFARSLTSDADLNAAVYARMTAIIIPANSAKDHAPFGRSAQEVLY